MDDQKIVLVPKSAGEATVDQIDAPTKNNPNAKGFMLRSGFEYTWMDAESDEQLSVPWFITGKHGTDPAMAEGSALTYNERYFLLKFFQIPTAKDDPEHFESKTGEKVTPEQVKELKAIVAGKGYPEKGKGSVDVILMAYATKQCQLPSIDVLPQAKFETAKTFLSEIDEHGTKK